MMIRTTIALTAAFALAAPLMASRVGSPAPEIMLIDGRGTLVCRGAIDDGPTADQADIKGARNHLLAALGELKAGKPISAALTKPYGCSVKYAS